MPTRRQIREATIQFLYYADLEGGADPASLRDPFWEFLSENDRRNLQLATARVVKHLASGREDRLSEFVQRAEASKPHLKAHPPAEPLLILLNRLLALESSWSICFQKIRNISKNGNNDSISDELENALQAFFLIDQDLAAQRELFLKSTFDFPDLKAHYEASAASIRRLQRISERVRMVENPENFPDQADLVKLRRSRQEIREIRSSTDTLVDGILEAKEQIDAQIATVLENYVPERIDPVDRAILRLGAFELMHTKTPQKAILNEAIELAKKYGTTNSQRFVNGILNEISRSLDS